MFSRRLITFERIKVFSTFTNFSGRTNKLDCSNKFFRKSPIFFNSVRHSSISSSKKALPIILSFAVAGSAAVAYSLLRKKEKSPVLVEESVFPDEKSFVQEHLEEDLALLAEFGSVPYLLIGAGCASFAAYRAIRSNDPTAKVIIIGDESYLPYMRPPLSKEMWFDEKTNNAETLSFPRWDGRTRSVFYEPSEYFFPIKEVLENKNGGIAIIRGKKVTKIDPDVQVVTLDKGEKVHYNKCLIATGSLPKKLKVFEDVDPDLEKNISVFRTIHDYKRLDWLCKKVTSVVIVGGGFLGSELTCGLSKRATSSNLEVVQIFPEKGNLGKVLPDYLSKWTTEILAKEKVKIIPEVEIKSVSKEDNKICLTLSNESKIITDHVVLAVGSDPNTQLGKESGLEIDERHGGFLVNAEMEARKNLWVAGDASCFYDIKLGRRRVEHYDHAVVSGRLAGQNMAGNNKPYTHQSMFWSDLGNDIGFEAVGVVDSSLPTVGVFVKSDTNADNTTTHEQHEHSQSVETVPDYSKGVVFYLRENVVVGVVLWNLFTKLNIARQVIKESMTCDDLKEVAKLFELYSSE